MGGLHPGCGSGDSREVLVSIGCRKVAGSLGTAGTGGLSTIGYDAFSTSSNEGIQSAGV